MSSSSSADSSDTDTEVLPIPIIPTGGEFIPAPAVPGQPAYIMTYPAGTPGGQVQFVFAQAPPQIPIRRRRSDLTGRPTYSEVQRRRHSRSFRSTGHEDEEGDHRETGCPSRRPRKREPHLNTELLELVKSLKDEVQQLQNKFDSQLRTGTGPSSPGGNTEGATPTSHQQKNVQEECSILSDKVAEQKEQVPQSSVSSLKETIGASIPIQPFSPPIPPPLPSAEGALTQASTHNVTIADETSPRQTEGENENSGSKGDPDSLQTQLLAAITSPEKNLKKVEPKPKEEVNKSSAFTVELTNTLKRMKKSKKESGVSSIPEEAENGIPENAQANDSIPEEPVEVPTWKKDLAEKNKRKSQEKSQELRKAVDGEGFGTTPEDSNKEGRKQSEEDNTSCTSKKALAPKVVLRKKQPRPKEEIEGANELEQKLRRRTMINESGISTLLEYTSSPKSPKDISTWKNELDEKKKHVKKKTRRKSQENENQEKKSCENKENTVPPKQWISKKGTSNESSSCSKADADFDNFLKNHNIKGSLEIPEEKSDPIPKLDGKDVCELSVKEKLRLLHKENLPKNKPLESSEKSKVDKSGNSKEKIDPALVGKDVSHLSVKEKLRLLHKENLPKNKIPPETIVQKVEVGNNTGNKVEQLENPLKDSLEKCHPSPTVETSAQEVNVSLLLTEDECVFQVGKVVQKTKASPPTAVIPESMQRAHPKEPLPDPIAEENTAEDANLITTIPISTPPPPPPPPQVEAEVKSPPKQNLLKTTNPSPEHLDAIGALLNDIRNREKNLRKVSESDRQRPLTDEDRIKAAIGKRANVMRRESDDENEPRSDAEGDWSD